MLVTMTTQIGGFRNEEPWPAPGGTLEVPAHEAADLIAAGYAEEATDAAPTPPPSAAEVGPDAPPADEATEAPAKPVRRQAKKAAKRA